MTEEEKKQYVDQNKVWVLLQQGYIDSFVLGIRNSKDMVKHHSEYLNIAETQLQKELKYLEDGKSNFRNQCIDNNIKIPDWAK